MGHNSSHRRKFRQHSHNQSHAQSTATAVLQGHPLVPTGEAVWIDCESDFRALCDEIAGVDVFSFDTEFIGEDSYYPKTCLVQVATKQKVALIDPFAVHDLSPLHELVANPDITTLLHSGSQDLEPVARLFKKAPAAIFDTQIAAGFVGFPWPISLTKIIEAILGHDVGGHFTFSQWDARPLTQRQCVYAADDVRYLIAIHSSLQNTLEELGRTTWVEEEFSTFTSLDAYQFDLYSTVKRICRNKNPQKKEMQRIQAITEVREGIAKERNLPTRSIIPNECVISLARNPVDTIDQLASMRGFPKNIAKKYGKQLLSSIQNAGNIEPMHIRKPQAIEREARMQQELDGAWSLFGAWCVGNQLSLGLVVNRPTFTDWYLSLRSGSKVQDSPLLEGWRREAVNEFKAMAEGNGELSFTIDTTLEAKSASK